MEFQGTSKLATFSIHIYVRTNLSCIQYGPNPIKYKLGYLFSNTKTINDEMLHL